MEGREYNFSEHVKVHEGIEPGEWRYLRKSVAFCGGGQVFYMKNFDLPLTITEKK